MVFFFNDTATTEIYALSLHDALPILTSGRPEPSVEMARWSNQSRRDDGRIRNDPAERRRIRGDRDDQAHDRPRRPAGRSEEHTSELQSRQYLVCRLLLEKIKLHTQHP